MSDEQRTVRSSVFFADFSSHAEFGAFVCAEMKICLKSCHGQFGVTFGLSVLENLC